MIESPSLSRIAAFLKAHHDAPVRELAPLSGGFWSSAYGYRVGARHLVLRLSTDDEGFRMDRAATRFARPGLAIPDVLDVGRALGGAYAISVRHFGRFLEDVHPKEAHVIGPTVVSLLESLRSASPDRADGVHWEPGGQKCTSWHDWLLGGLVDDPSRTVAGWRARLADRPGVDALFRATEREITTLAASCPERRDLVHGDLLHQNVLLSPDGTELTAVFSWKCSVLGDFLYDVAWCSFWGAWHPGIAAADIWGRIIASEPALGDDLLVDAERRHRCYQLHVGATHLAWNAWTGDDTELERVAEALEPLLEAG